MTAKAGPSVDALRSGRQAKALVIPRPDTQKKAENLRPWPGTLRFSMVCFYGLFLS